MLWWLGDVIVIKGCYSEQEMLWWLGEVLIIKGYHSYQKQFQTSVDRKKLILTRRNWSWREELKGLEFCYLEMMPRRMGSGCSWFKTRGCYNNRGKLSFVCRGFVRRRIGELGSREGVFIVNCWPGPFVGWIAMLILASLTIILNDARCMVVRVMWWKDNGRWWWRLELTATNR